jgi:hypothetical protein
MLLNNSHQQLHTLSDTLGPSKSTIHRHLTALGKIYKTCRFVSHELTVEQAQRQVEFCHKLLQLPKGHRFIKIIVTCDEKRIYLNNPDLHEQWLDKGQLPVLIVKRESASKKWSTLHLVELQRSYLLLTCARGPYNQRGGIFSTVRDMYTVLLKKYPALVNRKHMLLQQENARPHTAKKTPQKIEELEGTELLPRPRLLSVSFYGPVPSW